MTSSREGRGKKGTCVWRGEVASKAPWDSDSYTSPTTSPPMYSGNLRANRVLISRIQNISRGQPRQVPAALWLPLPLVSLFLSACSSRKQQKHTKTHTHIHALPWSASYTHAPVSLLTHSPWLSLTRPVPATHYHGACGTNGCPSFKVKTIVFLNRHKKGLRSMQVRFKGDFVSWTLQKKPWRYQKFSSRYHKFSTSTWLAHLYRYIFLLTALLGEVSRVIKPSRYQSRLHRK